MRNKSLRRGRMNEAYRLAVVKLKEGSPLVCILVNGKWDTFFRLCGNNIIIFPSVEVQNNGGYQPVNETDEISVIWETVDAVGLVTGTHQRVLVPQPTRPR